jgi:hypothetical protein
MIARRVRSPSAANAASRSGSVSAEATKPSLPATNPLYKQYVAYPKAVNVGRRAKPVVWRRPRPQTPTDCSHAATEIGDRLVAEAGRQASLNAWCHRSAEVPSNAGSVTEAALRLLRSEPPCVVAAIGRLMAASGQIPTTTDTTPSGPPPPLCRAGLLIDLDRRGLLEQYLADATHD